MEVSAPPWIGECRHDVCYLKGGLPEKFLHNILSVVWWIKTKLTCISIIFSDRLWSFIHLNWESLGSQKKPKFVTCQDKTWENHLPASCDFGQKFYIFILCFI